jgi:hypothetical protein
MAAPPGGGNQPGGIMPINVSWHNEDKSLVVITFEGTLSWDEVQAGYTQAWQLILSQPHTVNLFNDGTRAPTLPPGNALGNFRSIWKDRPANFGMAFVFGGSQMGRALSEVFLKAIRLEGRLRFVNSIEEAEALIAASADEASQQDEQA